MTNAPQQPSDLLQPDEIRLLSRALGEWVGTAHPNDHIAHAMGFTDVASMWPEQTRLNRALREDTSLEPADWARILASTEIVFVSDLYGSGVDWRTVTGWDDEDTIRILRRIQRKLGPVLRGQYGNVTPRHDGGEATGEQGR